MVRENEKPLVLLAFKIDRKKIVSDCDCADCACSLIDASYIDIKNKYLSQAYRSAMAFEQQLDEVHTLLYGPFHEPAVLNKAAISLLQQFTSSQTLQAVNPNKDEIVYTALSRLQSARLLIPKETQFSLQQTSQKLSAWLHITDRCNLRCTYCYLPHVKHDMSWETGKKTVETIVKTAFSQNYPTIQLKYSGGEALLRFSLVKRLHQYAQKLAQQYKIELHGTVLSNGTLLTHDIAKEMRALNLNLMISLDGLGRFHDAHRPYAGGRGSFTDVQEGITIAQANNLNTMISITISGSSAGGLGDVVRWVLAQDLRFNLNFYRENKRSSDELTFEDEQIIAGMLAAYKEIEKNMPDYSLLDAIVDRANLSTPHLRTCGVGQNYVVFDHNGRVNKCQMHLYDGPPNQQTDDPLIWIQNAPQGIQNLPVDEKEGCNTCEWKYWCAGGCPLVTYKATGTFNKRSPNCAIYKAIYPEAMRLEGLRLLRLNR